MPIYVFAFQAITPIYKAFKTIITPIFYHPPNQKSIKAEYPFPPNFEKIFSRKIGK